LREFEKKYVLLSRIERKQKGFEKVERKSDSLSTAEKFETKCENEEPDRLRF
jgi:hypothetical protein